MRTQHNLDLSSMVARVLLALLVALSVTLMGLWLRASDALSFVSTLLAVTISQIIASALRGERIGPPTAAAERFQPLVDTLAEYPGGRMLGTRGFKRGVTAFGIGLVVATGASIISALLFSSMVMAPIWRSTIALGVILLPTNLWLAWTRSKQQFTGTQFAAKLADALREIVKPGSTASDEAATGWQSLPLNARVGVVGVGKTALTLVNRVLIQILIPIIFSGWLSITAVAVVIITWIAGGPVFASLGRTLVKPAPAHADAEEEV